MTGGESRLPARLNPFRVSRILQQRYRLDDRGWSALFDRLDLLEHRGALVGPEGSGKTTLLEEFEQRLEARGWQVVGLRLYRGARQLSRSEWERLERATQNDLITLDGAEQLGWWRWRRLERLSRGAGGLLITTHRPGRLPCLHEHRTSLGLLTDLVADLVGREKSRALETELARLFELHQGNLRDCLRALYDQWAVYQEIV